MNLPQLLDKVRACTHCERDLPLGPRPLLAASARSRVLIIGQAPGARTHEAETVWDDVSGDRLRSWLGVERDVFYDPDNFAHIPMGFCYPGKAASGDAPPKTRVRTAPARPTARGTQGRPTHPAHRQARHLPLRPRRAAHADRRRACVA